MNYTKILIQVTIDDIIINFSSLGSSSAHWSDHCEYSWISNNNKKRWKMANNCLYIFSFQIKCKNLTCILLTSKYFLWYYRYQRCMWLRECRTILRTSLTVQSISKWTIRFGNAWWFDVTIAILLNNLIFSLAHIYASVYVCNTNAYTQRRKHNVEADVRRRRRKKATRTHENLHGVTPIQCHIFAYIYYLYLYVEHARTPKDIHWKWTKSLRIFRMNIVNKVLRQNSKW